MKHIKDFVVGGRACIARMLAGGLVCLGFVACDYTVPLGKHPSIAIDRGLIGLWSLTNPNNTNDVERLLVLPLNAKEYLMSYPANAEDSMFARVSLWHVAGGTVAQITWFGTAKGVEAEGDRSYQYARYALTTNSVDIRMLNTTLVSRDVASSKALVKAIRQNWDNPELFADSRVFTRVQEKGERE